MSARSRWLAGEAILKPRFRVERRVMDCDQSELDLYSAVGRLRDRRLLDPKPSIDRQNFASLGLVSLRDTRLLLERYRQIGGDKSLATIIAECIDPNGLPEKTKSIVIHRVTGVNVLPIEGEPGRSKVSLVLDDEELALKQESISFTARFWKSVGFAECMTEFTPDVRIGYTSQPTDDPEFLGRIMEFAPMAVSLENVSTLPTLSDIIQLAGL